MEQPPIFFVLASSVFTEEDDLVMPELDINPYIPKLDILNISTETIKKKLDNLKIDKSPGPDNIHPRILRKLSNILSLSELVTAFLSLSMYKSGIEVRVLVFD
jgi:hypothetical protein